jgi:hypothetical protein
LTSRKGRKDYPEYLRRVKYRDPETGRAPVFLTNNFSLPALTTAALYKQRWQVELFFKWIKQHLQIKKFYEYSENAVKTQLWIAVATYCLPAIIRKDLKADRDLHEIQEILTTSIFQKCRFYRPFRRSRRNPQKVSFLTNCLYSSYDGTAVPKSIEGNDRSMLPLFEL